MSVNLTDILGGSVTEGVAKIIQLFKVDPTVAMQKQTEIAELQLQMQQKLSDAVAAEVQAQVQVNLAEAQNKNVFIAGWRPFVGWTCGCAFGYSYIVQPFLQFLLAAFHNHVDITLLPRLDLATMMPVMMGMLGLATMRSVDKKTNVGNGE